MREHSITIKDELGDIDIAWLEHGDPKASRKVICVHGLTRNAHDFDQLAEQLGRDSRVICVDVPGRRPKLLARAS